MNAPLIATAATTPSRLSDDKGFFTQWAEVADQRGVQVLYSNLLFDIEAVIGQDPDLLVLSATGADSVIQHQGELQAQGINTTVVNYSNQSWQQMAVELGKVTGLEQQAQDAIKRFDDYTAQVAATLTPPAEPVSVVGYNIAGSWVSRSPACPRRWTRKCDAARTWALFPVKTCPGRLSVTACFYSAAMTPTCKRFSRIRCWPTCLR